MAASCFAFSLLLVTSLVAEEGMWRFDQVPFDVIQKNYGVSLDASDLARLQGAAVRILSGGGGGTGTFASSKGIILTNHHVALDCIRSSSLAEQGQSDNLVKNGFTAKNMGDELACKRFIVQVERQARDVTAELDAVVTAGMEASSVQMARQAKRSELERNCQEQAGENFSCSVEEFNSGAQSLLVTYEEYRDIRLVYAPEKQLGYFGGDEMNFRFPRFSSDISILRAYRSADGTNLEHDVANVPVQPEQFLKVSLGGVKEGELALVAGFPGSTNRYRMSFSADYNLRKGIPNQLKDVDHELELLRGYAGQSEENMLALQSRIFGLANARKYLMDVLTALENSDIVANRRHREESLMAFVQNNPELAAELGDVLTLQAAVYRDDVEANAELDSALGWLSRSRVFSLSYGLYEFALERAKSSDEEREPQFQQRNWPRVRQGLLNDDPIIAGLEEDFLTIGLEKALALPAAERVRGVEVWREEEGLGAASARELAQKLLANTRVGDLKVRETLITDEIDTFNESTDWGLRLAREIVPDFQDQRRRIRTLNQKLFTNRAKFARGMVAWKAESLFPDANFTLRLSFGRIAGYKNRRGEAVPYATQLAGMFDLSHERGGTGDFALPDQLRRWREEMTDDEFQRKFANLTVDYVTTNDITGGNSGSALLNGSLQIVGLAFDGNADAVASDWVYNETSGRAIITDIGFALTIARDVHGAGWIVDELVGS